MKKVDKKALAALLTGLLVIAFAGCQPKDELEESSNTASTEESAEVQMSEEVLPAVDKNTEDTEDEEELIDPPGYNAVEPENPNLVTDEEENV